jgi:lipopolysaccharide/colanic/teichoic acid biosynthesis glycosyltransferase
MGASVFAVLVRYNFEEISAALDKCTVFLICTAIIAPIILVLSKVHLTVWRYSTWPDYFWIAAVAGAISGAVVIACLSIDPEAKLPRTLPLLQSVFVLAGMSALRALARFRYTLLHTKRTSVAQFEQPLSYGEDAALVIGLSGLAEGYLRGLAEVGDGRIRVVGLLGQIERQVGRTFGGVPVLGTLDQLTDLIAALANHGIEINRLIIAIPRSELPLSIQEAVARVGNANYLVEALGLDQPRDADSAPSRELLFDIPEPSIVANSRRTFWALKRAFDVVLAGTLLVMLMPVMAVVAVAVAFAIGRPVIFWQERPGLGGRSIKLIKFRTMAPATLANLHLPDEARLSRFGTFLRRTRLDELPQLINILRGDMSFVGPRPLLPRDQPAAYRARLLVRPGLTGWAQVVGGRTISAEDKAALDIWYVQNATLLLDFEILGRTAFMLIRGDAVIERHVRQAWQELTDAGILAGRRTEPQ